MRWADYLYSTLALIDIFKKDPDGAGYLKILQSLRPFNDDSSFCVVENLIDSQAIEPARLDPVQVDVKDLHLSGVLIDKGKRGAGDFFRIAETESSRESSRERSFAGAEISMEEDVRRGLH